MKAFIVRERARFREFNQAHPYLGRLVGSLPGGVFVGVLAAAFLAFTPAAAVGFGALWAGLSNTPAIGKGLVRAGLTFDRRFPRAAAAVHRVGLGRLPWVGTFWGSLVINVAAGMAGFGALAAVSGGIVTAAVVPALAKISVRDFKRDELSRDNRSHMRRVIDSLRERIASTQKEIDALTPSVGSAQPAGPALAAAAPETPAQPRFVRAPVAVQRRLGTPVATPAVPQRGGLE